MKNKNINFLHKIFRAGVLVKGIHGVLELIFAAIIYFFNFAPLSKIIHILFAKELANDPADYFALHMVKFSSNLTNEAKLFVCLFLLISGAINILLAVLLLKDKIWAYPLASVFMGLFVIYQIYRLTTHYSVIFLITMAVDVVIILLMRLE